MSRPNVLISEYVPSRHRYDRKLPALALAYAELYYEAEVERSRRAGDLFGQEVGMEERRRKRLCALVAALMRRTADLLDGMREEDVREAFDTVFGAGEEFYEYD